MANHFLHARRATAARAASTIPSIVRACAGCGREFRVVSGRSRKQYCYEKCWRAAKRRRALAEQTPPPPQQENSHA